MSPQIRPASPADLEFLVAANRAIARETEHRELDEATVRAGLAAVLARGELGVYWIAELDGEPVACLLVTREWSDWRNGLFWWVQSVYVVPAARRHGVFSALYRHVRDAALADPGVCGLRLYVERENERAQATYRRLGMIETTYRLMEEEFHR